MYWISLTTYQKLLAVTDFAKGSITTDNDDQRNNAEVTQRNQTTHDLAVFVLPFDVGST